MLTLCTAFGILLHDTRLDHAVAMSPVRISDITTLEAGLRWNDLHTHAERTSFSQNISSLKTSEPTTRPRDDDDNKYVVQKKPNANSYGSVYSWPSV